jgi:hypothetical protein
MECQNDILEYTLLHTRSMSYNKRITFAPFFARGKNFLGVLRDEAEIIPSKPDPDNAGVGKRDFSKLFTAPFLLFNRLTRK